MTGCSSTIVLLGSEENYPVEFSLDANEPAPFPCMCMTVSRFEYLLRCEDYVKQLGVVP